VGEEEENPILKGPFLLGKLRIRKRIVKEEEEEALLQRANYGFSQFGNTIC
jgi:hypothetical protein